MATSTTTTTAKVEYDARLGGTVQLPVELSTYRYTAERVTEIRTLLGAIRHPNQTKLVFQTLPPHMRRRAMSHNPKRLPRRYRAAHIAQQRKSGGPRTAADAKRPSRKYRRKAGNMQREFERRQRRQRWLETHLWHAKRFHMVERWGYKLPQRTCDKTFRAAYRAAAEHCLLQDVSYVAAVEVHGDLEVLRAGFARITSAECGLGVCARTYVHGGREAVCELFGIDRYPFGAVGRVNCIWQPAEEHTGNTTRTLWLFAHASFYADVVLLLRQTFGADTTNDPAAAETAATVKDALPTHSNPITGVRLTELKDTLNRFRLTGPLSHAVLAKALRPKSAEHSSAAPWFTAFLAQNGTAHAAQSAYWQAIGAVRSATELTPNMVLALNVDDPRLSRPAKRTKALPATPLAQIAQPLSAAAQLPPPAPLAVHSPLWSAEQRTQCSAGKMTTAELCGMRNRHALVPGERCAFEDDMQPMPVLLVQRPGSEDGRFKRLGWAGGWDVIVPAGYGVSTWMCLVMWGARAGGLREVATVWREGGRDEFVPDTVPAAVMAGEEEHRLREEFFKKPQNKRINYTKLAINSPFLCRWSQLIDDWSTTAVAQPPAPTNTTTNTVAAHPSPFYVLRNRTHLATCQQVLAGQSPPSALAGLPHPSRCLIAVQLRLQGRGHPDNQSLICLPLPSDLRRQRRQLAELDAQPVHTEPIHTDAGEPERRRLRTAHLALLKRLRARRVRAKRRAQQTAERRVLIAAPQTAQLVRDQRQRMRDLWLPPPAAAAQSVRAQCSREVLGYVTQANFSLSEATAAGVGYITLAGLRRLVQVCGKVAPQQQQQGRKRKRGAPTAEVACPVLVRGTTSRQYRLASVRIGLVV